MCDCFVFLTQWRWVIFLILFIINTEHQNFFGMDDRLGPVAISFRREEKEASSGAQYNYRIIFRTTEVKQHFPLFRFSVCEIDLTG